MLCIIPTLMVLSFFFNSRTLQTGILQTGPNQFVENQKQNQNNTGRFSMKSLPKRIDFFAKTFLPGLRGLRSNEIDLRGWAEGLPVTWLNTIWLNFFVESFGLKILSQVTTKLSQLHSNSRKKNSQLA